MASIDEMINKLWDTVRAKNERLMDEWASCFSGNLNEGLKISQLEIANSVTKEECKADMERNFLCRMMSSHSQLWYIDRQGIRKRRETDDLASLAKLFIRVMTENAYWNDFVVTSLNLLSMRQNISDLLRDELHRAARKEKVNAVWMLVKGGVKVQPKEGYTQLHSAAMAINPNADIAKLLIESGDGRPHLDKTTEDDNSTALHYAAANINVPEEFIQQFSDAYPRGRNNKRQTPFHVAAKSSNPNAIIHMID